MFGGRLGPGEIILILLVVMLLFGARRMPDMARSLGRSMRILKSETKAMRDDEEPAKTGTAIQEPPREIPASPPQPADPTVVTDRERTDR